MARRKKRRNLVTPSKTQKRLQKELYAQKMEIKKLKRRKKPKSLQFKIPRIFPNFSLKATTSRDLSAVILLFISAMVFLSLIGVFGVFGNFLSYNLRLIFGYGSYVLFLVLFFMGVYLIMGRGEVKEKQKSSEKKAKKDNTTHLLRMYIGSFFLIAFVLGLMHTLIPFSEIKESADNGIFGGYVGFVMNFLIQPYLDRFGAFVLFFFGSIFFMLFTFEISLKKAFNLVYSFVVPEKIEITSEQMRKVMKKKIVEKKVEKEKGEVVSGLKKVKDEAITIKHYHLKKGEEWDFPHLNLLNFDPFTVEKDDKEIEYYKNVIQQTLDEFNIPVEMDAVTVGPTVTQYTFKPEAGVKLSKIIALQNDLAMALAASSIRIEAPIPGKSLVGIEIPNSQRVDVKLRQILESSEFNAVKSNLRLVLGRNISGAPVVVNLARMPHLLVAGATGSGKSVGINTFLISLLYQNSPNDLKLILVDPKRVELMPYNNIPHLLTPVITDPAKTVSALRWAVAEMERRYKCLADKGCRNIVEFNSAEIEEEEKLPYVVIVIDELADLMMVASKEVEVLICRIAQKARAVGMHLIIATQRPSVDVITGLIKANIPARISFTVSSSIDSRTITGQVGSEKLLGRGDMLYLPGDESTLYRIQGVYITTAEVSKVLRHIKLTKEPEYKEEILAPKVSEDTGEVKGQYKIPGLDDMSGNSDEDIVRQAIAVIIESKKASASFLQRRLKLGYSRAARIIDILEERGYIGPSNGSKAREVYVSDVEK